MDTSACSDTRQHEEQCYICLAESTDENPLSHPCACPRACHLSCLSRWQLQSAGKSEETHCRFCQDRLPHWSESLAEPSTSAVETKPSQIIMGIKFKGKAYKIKFEDGVVSAELFKREVRRVLQLPDNVEIDANFLVVHPQTGERLCLSGFRTYEAAAKLAAMNAAKRSSSEAPRTRSAASQTVGGDRVAAHDQRPEGPLLQRLTQGFKQILRASTSCVSISA